MKLLSVFVGKPTTVEYNGRPVTTGIFKSEVKGPVNVNTLNLEGDQQADLTVHGGVDKAVYAYPSEHYEYWKEARPDLVFTNGVFGENLSVTGLFENQVFVGDEYRIGSVRFAVTIPRMPCFKLGIKMNDPRFIKDFMLANRNGFYLKVLEEGELEAGDEIELISKDAHGLTIEEVVKLYTVEKDNQELLEKAIGAPGLAEDWREYFVAKRK